MVRDGMTQPKYIPPLSGDSKEFVLFMLRFYIPVNNFSVLVGQFLVFLG